MAQKWLTAKEAASHVRLSDRAFRLAVMAGRFPQGRPVTEGGRRKVWLAEELDRSIMGEDTTSSDPIMDAIHKAYPETRFRPHNRSK